MDNKNTIYERKNIDGSIDYIVDIGSILYNNRIVDLSNLLIPLRSQIFFNLPSEKNYYAAINVYYKISDGNFIFDTIEKSDKILRFSDSNIITNVIPIAQFIIQQSLSSFEVKNINSYSKMSVFSITSNFLNGDQGAKGPVGSTGLEGFTGTFGETGLEGCNGITGTQGMTGIGIKGPTGNQGMTGYYPDLDLLTHYKFKTDDIYLTDYSVYERDFEWGSTGAGVTGIFWTGIYYTETGIEEIDQGQTDFIAEEGIKDNCHAITYRGGLSGYEYSRYIGFTGVIQAWVNLDVRPIANFIYEIDQLNPLKVQFTDTSLYYPTELVWDVNGTYYGAGIFTHIFPASGTYIVKLTATNLSGSMSFAMSITV